MGAAASARFAHLSDKTLKKDQLPPLPLSEEDVLADIVPFNALVNLLSNKTDVFMTHNWGKDQENHKRVAEVNTKLQEKGVVTWFDSEKMEGDVKEKMTEGIDNASCVIVFVTQEYINKVAGQNADDNCRLEFGYAARRKTADRMIPVVMESGVRNTSNWKGKVGMVLGDLLYVDMCDGITDAKINELLARILSIIGERLSVLIDQCVALTEEIQSTSTSNEVAELQRIINDKNVELARINEAYRKETILRKKYKNELEDIKGSVRVYARCRLMNRREIEMGSKRCVEIIDETSMKVITEDGEKEFAFDAVFSETATQEEVFQDTKHLVESCMDGVNVCLFAYGQTGSGKTYTMTGSSEMPGLTQMAITELFRLSEQQVQMTTKVRSYFVELYNDRLVDLYWSIDKSHGNEAHDLKIKLDERKMVYIENCVIKEVSSSAELLDLFHKGCNAKHVTATMMNSSSSRSHTVFALMVETYDKNYKRVASGKLSFVDLAGSERASKTGASGQALKEAANINMSLTALGNVISALSEEGKKRLIPYRDSELTMLMQDSLGGNAKTLMFVNFSPADYNADETIASLRYASRVKKIKNKIQLQESEEIIRLKGIISKLTAGAPVSEVKVDYTIREAEAEAAPAVEEESKV